MSRGTDVKDGVEGLAIQHELEERTALYQILIPGCEPRGTVSWQVLAINIMIALASRQERN